MDLPQPLTEGRLVRRYKRFLADVELAGGEVVTVHCPNPGRMAGLDAAGARVWLKPAPAGRKLPFGLELVEADGVWVGINTGHPNGLVREALALGAIAELRGYASVRAEVRYGSERSRIDFLLEDPGRPPCWVEIKNVHWKVGRFARFPDAVTSRGAKHARELAARVSIGERAVLLYVIQREDCEVFGLADRTDPAYAAACRQAKAAGVEILAYACAVRPDTIRLERPLPVDLQAPED
ncbi:MAG: DNA/RNA nuclease SfsA [Geminicoccaceae bacterium]|nr:MAG: DNA/RNA nuclease SfsA [Geminicoccaceae bacterium]